MGYGVWHGWVSHITCHIAFRDKYLPVGGRMGSGAFSPWASGAGQPSCQDQEGEAEQEEWSVPQA